MELMMEFNIPYYTNKPSTIAVYYGGRKLSVRKCLYHWFFVFIWAIYINMNAVSQQDPQLGFSNATRAHLCVRNNKKKRFFSTVWIFYFKQNNVLVGVWLLPELKRFFILNWGGSMRVVGVWRWGGGWKVGHNKQFLLTEHVNK